MLRSSKHRWFWEEPAVMCGNWNVKLATSEQVFKVTTFCTDTCFQSFLPLINYIVHHALVKISPYCNKTLPQLVCIADSYSIQALLQHVPDVVIYRVKVRTVGLPQGLMNWDVSQRRSSTLSRPRCAGALSWWKTNMSPAMLRIADSSFCVSNTSR